MISVHYASMLAARENTHPGSAEREFDFIFTYHRDLILQCAQALMLRIAYQDGAGTATASA
ncbi:MAG: hypothetical protein ACRDNK_06075 [Solirubrobacteraceae bacterium]